MRANICWQRKWLAEAVTELNGKWIEGNVVVIDNRVGVGKSGVEVD